MWDDVIDFPVGSQDGFECVFSHILWYVLHKELRVGQGAGSHGGEDVEPTTYPDVVLHAVQTATGAVPRWGGGWTGQGLLEREWTTGSQLALFAEMQTVTVRMYQLMGGVV